MAVAFIDHGMIGRLIAARLNSAVSSSDMLIRYLAEEQPVGAAVPWAHMIAIDLTPWGRSVGNQSSSGGDSQDCGDVVITFTVGVPETISDQFELESACTRLRAALQHQTLLDSATGHRLDLLTCEVRPDPQPDDGPRVRTAGVSLTGIIQRLGGASIS